MLGGGSLAAGDLFDDAYKDCPTQTRLRDGQIADLAVARDADEADEVNVSWAATDPDAWGLGANAFRTSLVVILDDHEGDPVAKTLSLGSRKATFDDVDTGTEVTVEIAIVVATANGKYLISDILQKELHQSLTAPAFMTDVVRTTVDESTSAKDTKKTSGTFYYVGYNESFLNYRAKGLTTMPRTPRFRIGLAHTELDADGNRYPSDKGPYDAVDFDAYRVRITDADGDVMPEGDDVATVPSDYQGNVLYWGGTLAEGVFDDEVKFSNVRINEDGEILDPLLAGGGGVEFVLSSPPSTSFGKTGLSFVRIHGVNVIDTESRFSLPPNEHRDFPIDVLASDETYTFTAWAVNDEGEVISPVAALRVHPVDQKRSNLLAIQDYLNPTDPFGSTVSEVYVTTFTVLK